MRWVESMRMKFSPLPSCSGRRVLKNRITASRFSPAVFRARETVRLERAAEADQHSEAKSWA